MGRVVSLRGKEAANFMQRYESTRCALAIEQAVNKARESVNLPDPLKEVQFIAILDGLPHMSDSLRMYAKVEIARAMNLLIMPLGT